ncbi:two-component regulator propeller domain-containing protein [Chitinophaga filiformis]|uniref:histidine kinase n=1 Tax=Chitinophaga filiformis TaxID=104663 RepID=A0ABY4HUG1_CHIFI|nr:two-component regulator propeller domain-containing protein [Chitinophaga filiformis]UPK67432.1 ATP-binding protein [Chitinophaga filiformis]
MRFLIFVFANLISLAVLAQSEQYDFSKLDIHSGLSSNQVNTILKDADGFLWFGTSSGLNRYDGYSCRVFRRQPNDNSSLSDNFIRWLYPLPDGKMWVLTKGASCIYDAHTEKFDTACNAYLHSLGLPPGFIKNIVKGGQGRYWFLYEDGGLYLFSDRDKKTRLFNQGPSPDPAAKITGVQETEDGKLWMVYEDGFLQQSDIAGNKTAFSSTVFRQLNPGNNSYSLLLDNDGDVWIWCFPYGAFLFHPKDNSIRRFSESSSPTKLSSNLVTQIVQDKKGIIWIATDYGGVTLINKKDNFRTSYLLNDLKDPKSLSQNSIRVLYKDYDGVIWLGTYKQGLNYFNSNTVRFPCYRHEISNLNSLPYDDVNRFVEDKQGNIWIGTNGGGLIYFDRRNNTFRQYLHNPNNPNSLSNNVIVSLCIDHKGILWIGTYTGGLNSFDGNKFTPYKHDSKDTFSLSEDNVWEIFEDREQRLWIGTLGGGLDLLDRTTNRFRHHQFENGTGPLSSNYITAFMEDRHGNLWVGTDNGITIFEKNKTTSTFLRATNAKNSLSNNNIISIIEDSKGQIWVGTREGLNLFDEQTGNFQSFTTADGLPDNMILNIIEDNNNTLWMSTPRGLCSAIPGQKANAPRLFVVNYDETHNLQNREFNENAALKTRSGELLFGGPSGFNIIDPGKIEQSSYRRKIVFTGLQIFNNDIAPGTQVNGRMLLRQALPQVHEVDLKYKENVFSIEFASLDFPHSTQDKYAYMLEGFNTDWLYANGDQRRVTYTNIDPGHYVFKVKALNSDGQWSAIKTLAINIEPPIWRTPLAYVIYVLTAAGLFLLARRIILGRIHLRYEMEQQKREMERAHAIEQMKTKFFTNVSHEFRTPLSLIISPLDKIIKQATDDEQKKQLNLVQRNARRLLSLVNQLLDFRKMEVQEIKLHPSIGDIVPFCEDISLSFTDIAEKKKIRFSFSSDIDRLEMYFDRDKMEKILFNLLSNAFKYTHDGGTVSIRLLYTPPVNNESNGTLAIEVKDTGIGIPADKHERIFERFFQTDLPENMVNQGTGIGLAITKEFVKLHCGVINVESEPGKGTCFTVLLPAKKIYEPLTCTSTGPLQPEDAADLMHEAGSKNGKRKTILVVEDNEDLRFYLKDNLKVQYHVEEATNGKEAWEKLKALNPDLIVSDIMMPVMDGIELAKKVKAETLTSHIPIILLTARGSEEKQLEGFNVGVNDYMTKPFTFEILASRIRNLLMQQKMLQKRFQKQIEVNPGEVTVTPVDEKFLREALELVEKNMDNADFSVEDLSSAMCMNRVTLYRKILSLTGKTPIEFIRSIRLKRAAQLLEKSGLSVSEIAYSVGFNNPKHFSRFFKEEFQRLPSQYVTNKGSKDA